MGRVGGVSRASSAVRVGGVSQVSSAVRGAWVTRTVLTGRISMETSALETALCEAPQVGGGAHYLLRTTDY